MLKLPALLIIPAFFLVWLLLWLPIAYPLAIKLQWRPFQPSTPTQKIALLIPLYLLGPLLLGGIFWWQGSSWADYGLPLQKHLLATFVLGLLAGSSSLALLFGMQAWAGWIDRSTIALSLRQGASQVLLLLVLATWVGWTEELVFRGFLQVQLQQELPVWVAASVGSLIFALLHGLWEGKTVLPQLPGLWLMGMVLVLACWVNQDNLGLAWGLHAGWVWTIASFDALKLIQYSRRVPNWVTGLNDQPLAGIMGFLFLAATAFGIGLFGIFVGSWGTVG